MSDKGLAKAGRVWYANSSVRMSMVGMSRMSARRGGLILIPNMKIRVNETIDIKRNIC